MVEIPKATRIAGFEQRMMQSPRGDCSAARERGIELIDDHRTKTAVNNARLRMGRWISNTKRTCRQQEVLRMGITHQIVRIIEKGGPP